MADALTDKVSKSSPSSSLCIENAKASPIALCAQLLLPPLLLFQRLLRVQLLPLHCGLSTVTKLLCSRNRTAVDECVPESSHICVARIGRNPFQCCPFSWRLANVKDLPTDGPARRLLDNIVQATLEMEETKARPFGRRPVRAAKARDREEEDVAVCFSYPV